jgi:hypothetical protein
LAAAWSAALLGAEASVASLGLSGPVERAGPGAIEISSRARRSRPILGDVDAKGPSRHFAAVERVYRFRGFFFACEADEGKAPWPSGVAIRREMNVHDFAYVGK